MSKTMASRGTIHHRGQNSNQPISPATRVSVVVVVVRSSVFQSVLIMPRVVVPASNAVCPPPRIVAIAC